MIRSRACLPLLPLVLGSTSTPRAGVEEQSNFWPLASYETSTTPPGYKVDVLWPFIQAQRAGAAHSSRVLPFSVPSSERRLA